MCYGEHRRRFDLAQTQVMRKHRLVGAPKKWKMKAKKKSK
jgi:hypothetical protein